MFLHGGISTPLTLFLAFKEFKILYGDNIEVGIIKRKITFAKNSRCSKQNVKRVPSKMDNSLSLIVN